LTHPPNASVTADIGIGIHFEVAMRHASIIRRTLDSLPVATLLAAGASAPSAQTPVVAYLPRALPVVAPVTACEKLSDLDLSGSVGALTRITAATPVTDAKPSPYCRVTGHVEPAVNFEVRLPLASWTQRFVQTGCGGLCGNVDIRLANAEGCGPADRGELALASTDMGHAGGMEGDFGKDPQLRVDFAYRGVHVTTLAAKALIKAFYGQPAKYSYFSGCSDGGREALLAAQRYPEDFDGITAGAPAMNFTTQNTFYHGWNARKNTTADGTPVLTADVLPALHRAALQACDAADGLEDGLVGDPFGCRFDPGVLACRSDRTQAACLTPAQVDAARAIYAGARDAAGNKLVLGGPLPGSELSWAGVFVPRPGSTRLMSPSIATGALKYLVYESNPSSSYGLADLQFTRESFTETTKLHGLYDATNPDLSAFARRGGRLILWHGMADPHISPLNSVAYHTAMTRVMGAAAVEQVARLYLFPGGAHCGGGEGPFDMDLLSPIMAWVEQGTPPFAIIASHRTGGRSGPVAGLPPGMPPPGAPAEGMPTRVDRTRPAFPYPLTTKYNGSGSIDDARNFSPGPAAPVAADALHWLGASFYAPGQELWCQGEGTTLRCRSTP
jgi:feruloyl esterase